MFQIKSLVIVVSVVLIIVCSSTVSVFAQEQIKSDSDKPNLRDPRLLLIKIYSNGRIALNNEEQAGVPCLSGQLLEIFSLRLANGVYRDEAVDRNDLPDNERIAKAVWVLAAPNLGNETVGNVVNAAKLAGASPIRILTGAAYQKLLSEFPSPPVPLTQEIKEKAKVNRKKSKSN